MSASSTPTEITSGATTLRGWKSRGRAVAFWILAALGPFIMAGAWVLLILAGLEETTEQSKAHAAGTTMAGTTLLFGVVPLVLAHALGLLILGSIAVSGRYRRWTGVLHAVVAVAVASALGVGALALAVATSSNFVS